MENLLKFEANAKSLYSKASQKFYALSRVSVTCEL